MSKKQYDSTFCGSLPIQHINQVQSYGFLIITDRQFSIIQVSDNIGEFLASPPTAFVGKSLKKFLTMDDRETIAKYADNESVVHFTADLIFENQHGLNPFFAIVNVKDTHVLIELEPVDRLGKKTFNEIYQRIRDTSARISKAATLSEALKTAAQQLKRFSGFDKVMIYKFDSDWNGHVLAEEMEEGMESYLGNTFPASDIPKQARDLYLKNSYRLIPDINYKPARLFPLINPLSGGFVDLSDCNVRGVVKVHLEYLANMRVQCSMSSRILKDGVLWGLIACHHRTPKFVGYEECSVFELLSAQISSKISAVEVSDNLSEQWRLQGLQTELLKDFYSHHALRQSIEKCADSLMQILNCSGLIYTSAGRTYVKGDVPELPHVYSLITWLQTKNVLQPFFTTALSDEFEDGEQIKSEASGMVSFPINARKDEFLILFRKEILKTIHWGGNPNQAITFEEDMKTYHPRHSFIVWKEGVQGTSEPFTNFQINFINDFHRILVQAKIQELQ